MVLCLKIIVFVSFIKKSHRRQNTTRTDLDEIVNVATNDWIECTSFHTLHTNIFDSSNWRTTERLVSNWSQSFSISICAHNALRYEWPLLRHYPQPRRIFHNQFQGIHPNRPLCVERNVSSDRDGRTEIPMT